MSKWTGFESDKWAGFDADTDNASKPEAVKSPDLFASNNGLPQVDNPISSPFKTPIDDSMYIDAPYGDKEYDFERIHFEYMMSEERERAKEAELKRKMRQERQPEAVPLEGPRDFYAPGTPEYEEAAHRGSRPGALETWMADARNKTPILGPAANFLTGCIDAAVYGGNPVDYYRQYHDADHKTVMEYKPSQLQDICTTVAGVLLELPVFGGIGGAYNQATAYATRQAIRTTSDYVVRAGGTRAMGDVFAKNAVATLNNVGQAGVVLGVHSGAGELARQTATGTDLNELDWGEIYDTYSTMFKVGSATAMVGLGANYIHNSPGFSRLIDGSVKKKAASLGINIGDLSGQTTVFTVGEVLLDGDKSTQVSDISMDDVANAVSTLLAIKFTHTRAPLPKGQGGFSPAETQIISDKVKGFDLNKPWESILKNKDYVNKIMLDKSIPYTTKMKIAVAAGYELPFPMVSEVSSGTLKDGRFEVSTHTKDGTLIQVERFSSKSEADMFLNQVELARSEGSKLMEMAKLSAKDKAELDVLLEKAGVEGGAANELLMNAAQVPKQHRSPKQNKLANTLYETYDKLKAERTEKGEPLKYEEREVPEPHVPEAKMAEIVGEEVTKYTPQEIELLYETVPRLKAKIEHPRNGIDKLLSDIQTIRESGDYSNASLYSVTMRQHLPGSKSSTIKVRSEAELNSIEGKLKLRKDAIESELAERSKTKDFGVEEGEYTLGRKGFDSKADLYRELDKFENLEDIPEVHDPKTMQAISDYEVARYGKGIQKAQEVERVAGHVADKIRSLKPKEDPNTLQITVPGGRALWSFAMETAARAVETGAKAPRAAVTALNAVKKTTYYQRLSEIEQSRLNKQLMDEITEAYSGRPIDPLRTQESLSDQIKVHEETGGSTYSVKGENLMGTDKGSVSIFPERSEIIDGKLTPNRLQEYVDKNKDLLEANEDILAVGTWYDSESGKTYLDISSAVPIDKAFELGKKYNQKAIFDLKTGKEVSTGGTGTAVEGLPSESLRIKAIQKALGLTKPPKTAKQKQVDKATGVTKKVNRVVVNEYTALKDQIRSQAKIAKDIAKFRKEAQEEIQKFIGTKEFQDNLGVRATKTLARRLAAMDPMDPNSVDKVMAYIDKAITDAKFRKDLAEMDKVYDGLESATNPKSYTSNKEGTAKGKGIAVEYQDKIKKVRRDMFEGDWRKAQEEINKLQEEIAELNPGDEGIFERLDRIDELSFHGLLNSTSAPELGYLKSKLADIISMRKTGRSIEAGRRFALRADRDAMSQQIFDVMNAGKRKVVMASDARDRTVTPYDRVTRFVDWTALDSWFTLLDKMSRYDKSSKMFESDLSRTMGDFVTTAERTEYSGLQELHGKVTDMASKIFGVEAGNDLVRMLDSHTKQDYILKVPDGKGGTIDAKFSQNELYKRWQELQDINLKPSLTKQGFFDQFGEPTQLYRELEKQLDPKVKEWAEYQLNTLYPELHARYNEVYREIFGTDMPMHDKYSPIFVADKIISSSEAIENMINTRDIRGLAGNSHLKLRTGHAKELLKMDGDKVLMNYIEKMEFFRAWAKPLREMNHVFNRPEIRQSMEQIFGKQYPKTVDWFLDKFARTPEKFQDYEKATNFIRKNFTIGSLALKPTVFAKQLISFPAYADRIPTKEFMKGMGEWFNPKHWKEITEVLNESEYLMERYGKGWDRDVMLAMKKDFTKLLAGKNSTWRDKSMFMVKYGDRGAIIFGGWPVYKYHYNNAIENGSSVADAKAIAMREFEFATRQSQQASNIADLSRVQNHNPIMKLATMYKTSPLQYHRKVVAATRDLFGPGRNRKQDIKTILIYHALLPQLFQLVSNGFQWDGKDQLRALMWGNLNAIPVAGDFAKSIHNHIAGLPFGYQMSPVEDLQRLTVGAGEDIGDLWEIMGNLDNTDFGEIWDAIDNLANAAGKWGGNPVDAAHNTVSGIADAITGDTDYAFRRIMGWSENALDDDRYDLLRDLPLAVIDNLLGILEDDKQSWSDNDTVNNSKEAYDSQWDGFD